MSETKSKLQLREGAYYKLKDGTVPEEPASRHNYWQPGEARASFGMCDWVLNGAFYQADGTHGDGRCPQLQAVEECLPNGKPLPFLSGLSVATSLLPAGSKERKETPIYSGVLAYFPRALAYVAKVSKVGNDKHNPGEALHWSKDKSSDHADCVARHLIEQGSIDAEDGLRHSGKLAWRALALLEIELERETQK